MMLRSFYDQCQERSFVEVIEHVVGIRAKDLGDKVLNALENPENEAEESKKAEEQAIRIWTAIRKELIELAKRETSRRKSLPKSSI